MLDLEALDRKVNMKMEKARQSAYTLNRSVLGISFFSLLSMSETMNETTRAIFRWLKFF
jgi:hypothetical protein